ncbi:MAG: hypothetical protein ACRCTE_06950, partial [Cellulosilyticaceae bacterium]
SYVEVLGGLVIILLVGNMVLQCIQVASQLRSRSRHMTEATRLAENILTVVTHQLEQGELEGRDGEVLASEWHAEAIGAFESEKYTYQVTMVPIEVQGGVRWKSDNGSIDLSERTTYTFERQNLSGHYVSGEGPEDLIGAFKIILYQLGSGIGHTVEVGTVPGKAKLKTAVALSPPKIRATIEDYKGTNHKGKICMLIIDCSGLGVGDRAPIRAAVEVINQSQADVVVKLIGNTEQISLIDLSLQEQVGSMIVGVQEGTLGRELYQVKVEVMDQEGKCLKQLESIVGTKEGDK